MFWLDRQNGKSAEKQYSNTRLFMPVLHCAARDVEPNLLLVAPVGLQTFLGRMATWNSLRLHCQVSREQRMWCQRPMSCDLWCQCSKMFHAWLYCNALGQGYMSTTPPLSCPVLKSRGFQGSTEFDDVCFSRFPKDILNLYIYNSNWFWIVEKWTELAAWYFSCHVARFWTHASLSRQSRAAADKWQEVTIVVMV